jgi:hypothetical protein
MRKKHLFLGVMIVLAVLIISVIYIFSSQQNPQPQLVDGDLSVRLDIHDSLPKSILIQNDGTVTFTEGGKTEQATIPAEEAVSLKQSIQESDFFSLDERYEGSGCCDFVAHTIIVTIGNTNHSVYCYNGCPAEFDMIKDRIENAWPKKIEYSGFS